MKFNPGDRVRVTSGAWSGRIGTVEKPAAGHESAYTYVRPDDPRWLDTYMGQGAFIGTELEPYIAVGTSGNDDAINDLIDRVELLEKQYAKIEDKVYDAIEWQGRENARKDERLDAIEAALLQLAS